MIELQCCSCSIISDMPTTEPEEGVIVARCRYCGQEHEITFDNAQPLVYSEGTNNEGAKKCSAVNQPTR